MNNKKPASRRGEGARLPSPPSDLGTMVPAARDAPVSAVRSLLETHLASVAALLQSPALQSTAAAVSGGAPKRSAPSAPADEPRSKARRTDADAVAADAAAPAPSDRDAAATGTVALSDASGSDEHDLESLRRRLRGFAAERDWDQFHTPRNLALALVGEVGELCECFQWRGDSGAELGLPDWAPAKRSHLGEELADCLLYLVRLADKCDVDLPAAAAAKLRKNAAKYPAQQVRGSAKKYTEYEGEYSK